MQPQQQGGQYLPNMMHQGPAGMNMGPQSSVSMAAQQMLAQVRSPPQPNVRSPGPRGPPMGAMGMPSPRMQQSPRQGHPQPMDDSGSIFDPTILDITDEDLKTHILAGIRNIAALCLKIGYPTIASVPHSIINGMKNCMALAAVTDITFKEAETMKAYLADPSAFAIAAPTAAAVEAVEEKEAEKEESEEDSMDGGMFDMFG